MSAHYDFVYNRIKVTESTWRLTLIYVTGLYSGYRQCSLWGVNGEQRNKCQCLLEDRRKMETLYITVCGGVQQIQCNDSCSICARNEAEVESLEKQLVICTHHSMWKTKVVIGTIRKLTHQKCYASWHSITYYLLLLLHVCDEQIASCV